MLQVNLISPFCEKFPRCVLIGCERPSLRREEVAAFSPRSRLNPRLAHYSPIGLWEIIDERGDQSLIGDTRWHFDIRRWHATQVRGFGVEWRWQCKASAHLRRARILVGETKYAHKWNDWQIDIMQPNYQINFACFWCLRKSVGVIWTWRNFLLL